MNFSFSDFDTEVLGRKTATANLNSISGDLVNALRQELVDLDCELGLIKVPHVPWTWIRTAVQGLVLADLKLSFELNLKNIPPSPVGVVSETSLLAADEWKIRSVPDSDADWSQVLEELALKSRFSHFFGAACSRDLYRRWAKNLRANNQESYSVTLESVEGSGPVGGLIAARIRGQVASWDLVSFLEKTAGRGYFKKMAEVQFRGLRERGVERVEVATQIDNIRAIRAYCRLGFSPIQTVAQFHLTR
jgi:hypothetical protein